MVTYIPITFVITEYRGKVRKQMNKLVRIRPFGGVAWEQAMALCCACQAARAWNRRCKASPS